MLKFASKAALVLALAAVAAGTPRAWQQAAAPQQPRFAGGTDVVLVDVQVSRAGKAVEGLTAADFVVKDDGVVQKAELVSATLPVNLLLVLDTSASVRGPALEQLKEAARGAVAALHPSDQAALVTFSHNITRHSDFTADREQVAKAIAGVTAQGSTSLADAAFVALAYRTKPGTRTLALFFTDGDDTASWLPFQSLIPVARRSDAVVYGVTLANPGNTGALYSNLLKPGREVVAGQSRADIEKWFTAEPSLYRGALLPILAIETGGDSLQTDNMAKLRTDFTEIVSTFSKRYVLSFTPAGVQPTGWHPLEITVKSGGDVSARRGYSR